MNTTEILDTTETLNTTETTDPGIASSVIIAAAFSAAVTISIMIISIGLCIVVANKYTKTSESDTDHYYETPGFSSFSVTSSSVSHGVNNTPSLSVTAPDVVTQNTAYATVGVISEEEVPTQNTDEAPNVMIQNTACDVMTQNTAYPTALHIHAGDEAPDVMTKNTAYMTVGVVASHEPPDVVDQNTAYTTFPVVGDDVLQLAKNISTTYGSSTTRTAGDGISDAYRSNSMIITAV